MRSVGWATRKRWNSDSQMALPMEPVPCGAFFSYFESPGVYTYVGHVVSIEPKQSTTGGVCVFPDDVVLSNSGMFRASL